MSTITLIFIGIYLFLIGWVVGAIAEKDGKSGDGVFFAMFLIFIVSVVAVTRAITLLP